MSLIAAIDLETTGLDQSKGDRVIEIAVLTYDSATRKLIDRYVQRIDPERSISAGAQAVHGIAYSDLVGMPKWAAVAPEVAKRLAVADIMIAHNMNFDGPFLGAELVRAGLPVPNIEPYCTMTNGRWACFDGKQPRLSELAFALGVPFDSANAHAADYDTEIMAECFWRGIDRGFYTLPAVEEMKVAA